MSIPIRQMVLYKHGVGFFQREGAVDETSVSLSFRRDEINDVLKSIAAFDRAGGQVLGIHYQTPMDKEDRLAQGSIRLRRGSTLRTLLGDLRGQRVAFVLADDRTFSGRLVGMDTVPEELNTGSLITVADDDSGNLEVFTIGQVRSVNILSDKGEYDLSYFLDTVMSEDFRRTVTIRLSEGEHELVVSYVAPSPTWRVSYRIVAESEGEAGGKALVQGWGLFDNRLDEDLEDVHVTLVAGQPISFIYDLYTSQIPERPTVEEEARTVPRPVEYKAGRKELKHETRSLVGSAGAFMRDVEPEAMSTGARRRRPAPPSRQEMAETTQPAAEGREAGEFFQYQVTTPVSVKRGDSAMVPIIGQEVSYEKELLYNRSKLPDHPVAALRFDNTTGLTLERGPVTLVEDGDYIGEAIVPFTKAENDVYLPYAVELGIRVVENRQHRDQMNTVSIHEGLIYEQYARIFTQTYVITNTTDRDRTVTIEKSINPVCELYQTHQPDVTLDTHYRWRVEAPAGQETTFEIQEQQRLTNTHQIARMTYDRLRRYLDDNLLDDALYDKLHDLLEAHEQIQAWQREITELGNERAEIFERQEQIRENLKAVEGDEGGLRTRMLDKLNETEDRLEAIDERIQALHLEIAGLEERIEAELEALS